MCRRRCLLFTAKQRWAAYNYASACHYSGVLCGDRVRVSGPIIWNKISNAAYESKRTSGTCLSKPYDPNSIIKNDIEYILMLHKSGGNREPTPAAKVLSVLPKEHHAAWFRQVWDGPPGASTRHHPAPFPVEIVERPVRMFSFVGNTILDRITGTAKMQVVAKRWERNRISPNISPNN